MSSNEHDPSADALTRPVRVHVRLPCEVWLSGRKHEAITSNVSERGMYLRFRRSEVGDSPFAPGASGRIELRLRGRAELFVVRVEIVWINPTEVGVGGEPALGVGMRLLEPSPEVSEAFEQFVRDFRFTVLVVDDERDNLALLRRVLHRHYEIVTTDSADEAMGVLREREVAVALVDQRLVGASGIDFFARLSAEFPSAHTARVLMSAFEIEQPERAINAARLFSFVRKPFEPADLLRTVHNAAHAYAMVAEDERLSAELAREKRRLEHENAYLRKKVEIAGSTRYGIIGQDRALHEVLDMVERVARADSTVHIHGATGTGKELIARAIHDASPRRDRPFIAQNCAGMTESLLETTLFGHVRGAFTGADRDRPGVFQEAHGGTLFLDEVAELAPSVQSALLRAVQTGEIKPVGSSKPMVVDVRVISATHNDLKRDVAGGRFRADLYFRLVVIDLRVPSLAERPEDISLLARHFLDLHCERQGVNLPGFTPEALEALERYEWPGNVRELQNEVERLVVLADPGKRIPASLVSPRIRGAPPPRAAPVADGILVPSGLPYDEAVRHLERALVEQALAAASGVTARAARRLGMERTRLAKLVRRLGLRAGAKTDE